MATKGAFRGSSKGKLDSLERARNMKISKAEESQFSSAVQDMKSLLPGYDEATAFAYQQGRTMGRQGLPGAIPKPGRSVPKLNIEDLPMQFASNEVVLTGKTRSSLKSRQKATLPDDYNLMSKFDAAVFNPDAKLTQAVASKLKSSIKSKATMDVQANSVTDNVRADYLKIKSNVMGEIENELGFGFRSPDVNIVSKNPRGSEETRKAMESAAKKTETSVKALKKKLNSKKEEWKNDQFLLDSFRVKEPSFPASSFSSRSRGSTHPPNEKLKEMSDSFRKSLKVNRDMKRAIKTPRSSSTASKTAKDKGIDVSSSMESLGHSNMSGGSAGTKGQSRGYDSESGHSSSLFTRSNALYHPTSAGSGKISRDDTKKRKSVTIKGKHKAEDSSSKSSLDLSGIMPLNSLLESHPENVRRSIMKKSENDHSEQKTFSTSRPLLIDFEDLKDATSRLAELPKSSSNSTNNNRAITKVDSVTQKDYGGGETRIMSENFYQPPPDKGQMQKKETGVNVPVDDFLKQRLGESVKTVDDAATIATRLGSLMTRVAMSKSSHSSNSNLDTVSLARELREIASSMEKDYGGVLGVSSQTSGNVETQTEREQQKLMPQPKFTKEMSYTDQLLLQKLRSVQHEWGKSGNPTSGGVVSNKSSPLIDDNKK